MCQIRKRIRHVAAHNEEVGAYNPDNNDLFFKSHPLYVTLGMRMLVTAGYDLILCTGLSGSAG